MLGIVFDMERVGHAQERHQREHIGKDQAQAVHAPEHEVLPQEARHAIGSRLHEQAIDKGRGGQYEHGGALDPAFEERQEPGAQDEQEPWVHPLKSHSSPRGA